MGGGGRGFFSVGVRGGGGFKMTALKRNILSHLKITSFFFSFVTS